MQLRPVDRSTVRPFDQFRWCYVSAILHFVCNCIREWCVVFFSSSRRSGFILGVVRVPAQLVRMFYCVRCSVDDATAAV